MRDKWSVLVIIVSMQGYVSQQVLDFASPSWADVAYKNIKDQYLGSVTVIKLY